MAFVALCWRLIALEEIQENVRKKRNYSVLSLGRLRVEKSCCGVLQEIALVLCQLTVRGIFPSPKACACERYQTAEWGNAVRSGYWLGL
jgi:hypothetical protein